MKKTAKVKLVLRLFYYGLPETSVCFGAKRRIKPTIKQQTAKHMKQIMYNFFRHINLAAQANKKFDIASTRPNIAKMIRTLPSTLSALSASPNSDICDEEYIKL